MVIAAEPVRSPETDAQFASLNEAIEYVVFDDGITDLLQVPLPVPVVEPPLPLSVNVHAPLAVILPLMMVLPPEHIDVLPLVMEAVGLAFTVSTPLTLELPSQKPPPPLL